MSSTSVASPSTFRLIAADIKIAHSVFALPFALLAAFMAAGPHGPLTSRYEVRHFDVEPPAIPVEGVHYPIQGVEKVLVPPPFDWARFGGQLVLIVLAMVFARTVAMLANRLLDRDLDARNPRTAGRAIPAGELSAPRAGGVLLICAALFMGVCVAFGLAYGNWWPTILGLPVLAWISAYALLKRFTAMCHLYLGSSLALSPLAAAIAIQPDAVTSQPALWLLAGMVLCWVAGFDVIYALQDLAIDRAEGLHSIPAALGTKGALWVSRGLHAIAATCLVVAWRIDPRFGVLFAIGTGIVIALLIYEHATVSRWGTTKIALAFFTLNGVISCVLGGLGIADVLIAG